MDIEIFNLKEKLKFLSENLKSSSFKDLISEEITGTYLLQILAKEIVNPHHTKLIANAFSEIIILILEEVFHDDTGQSEAYQWKCVALSKLVSLHPTIQNFAYNILSNSKNIFWQKQETPKTTANRKRIKLESNSPDDIELVLASFLILNSNSTLFKLIWDWSEFFDHYWDQGCERQKFYCAKIFNILINGNTHKLSQLMVSLNIPSNLNILEPKCDGDFDTYCSTTFNSTTSSSTILKFPLKNYVNIEGVLLPIVQVKNESMRDDDPHLVGSTKINLRNVALAVSNQRPVCLSGPVGSGKTMLVEYLAHATGRLIKQEENEIKIMHGAKRKAASSINVTDTENLFLRVQLGDQTDSKTLLGQYRCTDVPGEFVWQAGILTQAVMNGSWILFEDLNFATQDVCTILIEMLENNCLNVPGYRDGLNIEPGFQMFFTIRNTSSASLSTQNRPFNRLEKHIQSVQLLPLSHDELCTIICEKFKNLSSISKKIVEIFLKFSRGCHQTSDFDLSLLNDDTKNLPHDEMYNSFENNNYSKRQVSTRDLFKLCKRSNEIFNVSSAECAYFVFQNAVDIFCAHLVQGKQRTELIIEIGATLGITQSRCEFHANEYKPEIENTALHLKIGRIKLQNEKDVQDQKKIKLDTDEKNVFSFTRIASNILERNAICIQQKEPVLLIGETGVGKTSSVQYLAKKLKRKLVVVNMNSQSDVSDLIGGFKPVDISHIMTPLRLEFETLFRNTFDAEKNEKFLSNISICFARGDFSILVKLMLKVVEPAIKKSNKMCALKWKDLDAKLGRIYKQLCNNLNLCFAFITGSLVNCMQNGNWILLDEINLASVETLEYLSTILEPNGSLVLVEKGDLKPIKRHPNFRIFACMNPSTDVGKKDLPQGIRNRFTEIFVDELTSETDLKTLIQDYLHSCDAPHTQILAAVKLYRKLCSMSTLELNDGLGNRPTYSLRTLCRALNITTKKLCGSFERNLYEAFCLSFLTQLDSHSREKVLNLIQSTLLSNSKAVLSKKMPKPQGNYINIEGYWIHQGTNQIQDCQEYIITDSVQRNLQDIARVIAIGKLPVLLQGPTSAGKTSLINYIAKKTGNTCIRINNHEHTDITEYCGTYVADTTGKLVFQEGALVQAMRNGYWIILDELNLASSDILEALNRVLDDNRELYIPETQTTVKAHPNFMLFATQNPPGLYGGRKVLSRAFKNRFVELHFVEIPKPELEIILEKRCLIPKSYAVKMVKTMSELQINRCSISKSIFTLRDLFRWGHRYTYDDKELINDAKYDWGQHLVDEGFLVLSSRVRSDEEIEIIQRALHNHFRKEINLQKLFSLSEETSGVTRKILNNLNQYSKNVVWTSNMRRMAVLTAKALDFNEPVLLVGPTGCGKTTICQVLADISNTQLKILNCHLHTESNDFLGGLRPYRGEDKNSGHLFEWTDGPLVDAMKEGDFFLADEISLAEDAVIERLNCLLEPERTLLLSEKITTEGVQNKSEEIVAKNGFQFMATMNPGGDFGKKELSPALRNRFTEIWCRPTDIREDLIQIATKSLNIDGKEAFAELIVDVSLYLKKIISKIVFSVRDVLAWCNYLIKNHKIPGSIMYGLQTIYLDALDMLPYELCEIAQFRASVCKYYLEKSKKLKVPSNVKHMLQEVNMNMSLCKVAQIDGTFGIEPFYIPVVDTVENTEEFIFTVPTTKENLFRLLSAFSIEKAILLEGAPGVGKTSLIENVAKSIGNQLVRINLCEQTDLTDLLGTDLPNEDENDGSFVWRDGPLLSALKSKNTWILLDELNLAPQPVLEGLNSVLDHRNEVFIPELNKKFHLGENVRIFATQNPLKQGGGRKGLPQSFLNRFSKVYLKQLNHKDLLHIVNSKYKLHELGDVPANLAEKIVTFSEQVDLSFSRLECGIKGGPFEANLRDVMQWIELFIASLERLGKNCCKEKIMIALFETMNLVYVERMRTIEDKQFIINVYAKIFGIETINLFKKYNDVSLFWNDSKIYFNEISIEKSNIDFNNHPKGPLLLASQTHTLKNIFECAAKKKPIILCGPSNSGKSKMIESYASIKGQKLYVDTIDDTVTGNFQQFDYNRHLDELVLETECLVNKILYEKVCRPTNKKKTSKPDFVKIMESWEVFQKVYTFKIKNHHADDTASLEELNLFLRKTNSLLDVVSVLLANLKKNNEYLQNIQKQLIIMNESLTGATTLSKGNKFEWVDSRIIVSIKNGKTICIDNVNLTSAAILDRLNPVFEPDGRLLIFERGESDAALVKKHENFQAVLNMDPKNGEISRAMRNRCIEICILKELYEPKDFKKIIYDTGITNLNVINVIVQIHQRLNSFSEHLNYSLSHLRKCSLLVKTYLDSGAQIKKSLLIAGTEVYIRPLMIDLVGCGITHFKYTLWQSLRDEINNLNASPNWVNYGNLCLYIDNLSSASLIRLQCEAFLALAKYSEHHDINTKSLDILKDLDLSPPCDDSLLQNGFLKYLLYTIYQCSSVDVVIRNEYLNTFLAQSSAPHLKNLLRLSDKFKDIVGPLESDLPWNTNLFRMSDQQIDSTKEKVIKNLLDLHLVVNPVEITKTNKLSQINAISYSCAIQRGDLVDSTNNVFLKYLYDFSNNLIKHIEPIVDQIDSKNLPVTAFWITRFYTLSQQKLFKNGSIDQHLIDILSLHFNWIDKNLLRNIDFINKPFMKILQMLRNFYNDRVPKNNSVSRLYSKTVVNYKPYYTRSTVDACTFVENSNMPFLIFAGAIENRDYRNCVKSIQSILDSNCIENKIQLMNLTRYHLVLLNNIFDEESHEMTLNGSTKLLLPPSDEIDTKTLGELNVNLQFLPVMEYFALFAIMNVLYPDKIKNFGSLNEEVVLKTKTFSLSTLAMVKAFNVAEFKTIIQKWSSNSKLDRDELTSFKIIETEYKSLVLRSFANRINLCQDIFNEELFLQTNITYTTYDSGPVLTDTLFKVLIGNDGNIRNISLNNLSPWRENLCLLKNLLWSNQHLVRHDLELHQLQISKNRALVLTRDIKTFTALSAEVNHLNELLQDVLNDTRIDISIQKSLIEILTGALELNLTVNLQLIDPVEKNRLKRLYCEQDILHIKNLLFAYECMGSLMNYKHFGETIVNDLKSLLQESNLSMQKLNKKVALRPSHNAYSNLVNDVRSFLESHCTLTWFEEVVKTTKCIENTYEFIDKLSLWTSNSNKFLKSLSEKYGCHYRDITAPLEYGLTLITVGFYGIIDDLKKVALPKTLKVFGNAIELLPYITSFENYDELFLKLMLSKLKDSINHINILKDLNQDFTSIWDLFKTFVGLWKKQEELLAKRKSEEESLYVTKTHCGEESADIIARNEINEMFPTFVDEDFHEFIVNDSLEQRDNTKKQIKDFREIFTSENAKEICTSFIHIMLKYSKTWYFTPLSSNCDRNYSESFKIRLSIYVKMFENMKDSLKQDCDYQNFASLCLLVGISQEKYGNLPLQQSTKEFNFYKDGNIQEVKDCEEILNKIEVRVENELKQWPEHAVLNDIIIIINRIRSLPCHSPIVRFSAGMQILRQRLDEWNMVAHKNNNLRDLEAEIAEYIQHWMRLELNHWRNCMSFTFERMQSFAYRFWFNIHGIIEEFMQEKKEKDDFVVFEKYLRDFMENSSYAQFALRLDIIRSFELYVVQLEHHDRETITELTSIFHHVFQFYLQFLTLIEEKLSQVKKPIEKKIKDFVKIESFNKDLSYFSMKNNIVRVHRQLHKFLKEYEEGIKCSVKDILSQEPKSNPQKNEATQNEMNVFSIDHYSNDSKFEENIKYLTKSKKVIKEIISKTPYGKMIQQLKEVIEDEKETVAYLKQLEINRSLERPKQIVQAKQILNQKRRALSDFFKLLSNWGINYRTGLLYCQLSQNESKTPPFSLQNISRFESHKQIDNLIQSIGTSDSKWYKSVLLLKLCSNKLQTPRDEIGANNVERIKGFSQALFRFAESQRMQVFEVVFSVYQIRRALHLLKTSKNGFSRFEISNEKQKAAKLIEKTEQLQYLLQCAPTQENTSHSMFNECNTIETIESCRKLLTELNQSIKKYFHMLAQQDDEQFCEYSIQMKETSSIISEIICKIADITKDLPAISCEVKDLKELNCKKIIEQNGKSPTKIEEPLSGDLTSQLLEGSLIAIQNLYKKYETFSMEETEEATQPNHLIHLQNEIQTDWSMLNTTKLIENANNVASLAQINKTHVDGNVTAIFEQYSTLVEYYCVTVLTTHKHTLDILHSMLATFLEIGNNAFCIPQDLLSEVKEEQQQEKEGNQNAGGFNMDNGEGEKDVSDKIESEDQLEDARKPGDEKQENNEDKNECKEEKGIDFSEDIDAEMQNLDKNPEESENEQSDDDDLDKEMGDIEKGADKLDDNIWGSDNEEENQNDEVNDEDGKGSEETNETHNNFENDTKKDKTNDGLDATDNNQSIQQPEMNPNEESDEVEQKNDLHKDLEEPPEAEQMNLDDEFLDKNDGEEDGDNEENQENPFDIDKFKDSKMEVDQESSNEQETENQTEDSQEKESEDHTDENDKSENMAEDTVEDGSDETPTEEITNENETDKFNDNNENNEESKDDEENKIDNDNVSTKDKNPSSASNIEQTKNSKSECAANESTDEKPSTDQTADLDEQDTGDDRDGIGQAESNESNEGHSTTQSKTSNVNSKENQKTEKNEQKSGTSDDRRALDTKQNTNKKLKTVDKVNEEERDPQNEENLSDANEFQHVKDALMSDKSTLDSATDEQSKQVTHEDEADKTQEHDEEMENTDSLEKEKPEEIDDLHTNPKLKPESTNSNKENGMSDQIKNQEENVEQHKNQIEGENIKTFNVPRDVSTTSHTSMEIVFDTKSTEEENHLETIAMRQILEEQLKKAVMCVDSNNVQLWQQISNKVLSTARELCEQLRLVLEPTKRTRFKGDYRTGRRINMKKIIPYIASQFRKDKIWLRRTKPAQRDYKITIAVDNSKSMDHNNSRSLTLEAIALVSQALTLLESGKLVVMSFGQTPQIIHKQSDQFEGAKLISALSFDENHSRIAELLNFVRVENQENPNADEGIFENLLLVLSDGRNIFSEGEEKVRNAVKLARMQRIFIVYVIIDNPENKHSILDIRIPIFSEDKKSICVKSYLDLFPFPYYIICRDLNKLPHVLSDAMRQWFELVNND